MEEHLTNKIKIASMFGITFPTFLTILLQSCDTLYNYVIAFYYSDDSWEKTSYVYFFKYWLWINAI